MEKLLKKRVRLTDDKPGYQVRGLQWVKRYVVDWHKNSHADAAVIIKPMVLPGFPLSHAEDRQSFHWEADSTFQEIYVADPFYLELEVPKGEFARAEILLLGEPSNVQ